MHENKIYYKFYPKDVPKHIEIPKIPLDTFLRDTAKKYPDSTATTYYNVPLSYRKLDEIADRVATKLAALGIKKGDTVALDYTNVPPAIACYYGILRIGGRVSMISPLFKSLEIQYQLNDSDAKVLILWEGFEALVNSIIDKTNVKTVIYSNLGGWFTPDPTIKSETPFSEDSSHPYLEDIIQDTKPNPPKVDIDPEKDLACLQYTGGTTGLPKGAMLTHYNLVANTEQAKAWFPSAVMGKEVMLTALPLYHIYAQTVAMNFSIRIAANQILIANPRDVEELIHAISTHKVTVFPGVSALYNLINNFPESELKNYDLTSLKFCLSGAGPLPLEIQNKFESLTGARLREGYGLTEASPITHANPLEGRFKNGTIGLPVPNTDIKITDQNDPQKVLGINEVGELCIKGPQVMLGYYKREKETRATLIDGWLYTGDLALIDDEGYTIIKERLKNMIKYKGHSVYPTEVEALLFQHEAILDCAVVGFKDPEVGENIKAYIVLKPEFRKKLTEQQLINWARENMASYKYPRQVEFITEIPKSTIGKTLHRILREGKTEE
ncbi:MAG TPA: long-chain fatty acid--CoA ligase [Candidatus Deferrimicrobium sp.]|nr:long-chain fatty acid--CoA ligase [Candidatus Deferrimicrobium sp.]